MYTDADNFEYVEASALHPALRWEPSLLVLHQEQLAEGDYLRRYPRKAGGLSCRMQAVPADCFSGATSSNDPIVETATQKAH